MSDVFVGIEWIDEIVNGLLRGLANVACRGCLGIWEWSETVRR